MVTTRFIKGHGTGNDFVILPDDRSAASPSAHEIRWLCDRRFGIGGDGLLRALPAGDVPQWDGDPDLWFMDYYNADGSVAQMCGNGLRVFARFLRTEGLIDGDEAEVATRSGVKRVRLFDDGTVRAELGPVQVGDELVSISTTGHSCPARPADVGNPHAVVVLDGHESVTEMDLSSAPVWSPAEAFPEGVNVEFVRQVGRTHVQMRVFERGVGETLSCGTGTVAVAAVMARRTGDLGPWRVDVPGGRITVELAQSQNGEMQASLTGPAVLVAQGEVHIPDDVVSR